MKKLNMNPIGWPCKLSECPPGHFLFSDDVCFKSDYTSDDGRPEAFCSSGESFWGGTSDIKSLRNLVVQPLEQEWEENE